MSIVTRCISDSVLDDNVYKAGDTGRQDFLTNHLHVSIEIKVKASLDIFYQEYFIITYFY